MGCHTWFYQKSYRTKEEAKELALIKVQESIDFYDIDDESKNDFQHYLWVVQFLTREEIEHGFKFWTRVKRMIEKDIFNPYKFQPERLTYWDKEHGFYINSSIHDIFRATGYPEDKFFDYPSLRTWVLKNRKKYNIQIDVKGWDKLKEYWEKYPESMVRFG